jgi:hypothetical protein
MYEVHPDNEGLWVLYEVGSGDFAVVAWFADKADAEFARQAFEQRAAGQPRNGQQAAAARQKVAATA